MAQFLHRSAPDRPTIQQTGQTRQGLRREAAKPVGARRSLGFDHTVRARSGQQGGGGERVWTAFDWPLFAEKARAVPNQRAFPAVEHYLNALGVTKFALLGADYVYPRTTNTILAADLIGMGIAQEDIFVSYTPFGHSDRSKIVGDVVALGADGKKAGVISTINGDANIGFYKEMVTAGALPVVAFSVGEEELSGLDTSNLAGHLAMLSAMP